MNWQTEVHREITWPQLEARQQLLVEAVQENPELAYLLISEPEPTYTYGRFASPSDLLWSSDELEKRSVGVFPVSRGGKWTYHGPGQVVLYPIVQLKSLGYSRHAVQHFLHVLRSSTLDFLQQLGVPAEPKDSPFGIYTGERKLVSFGIQLSRGICHHGLALYVSSQDEYFTGIHGCGQNDGKVASLAVFGVQKDWEDVASELAWWIKKGFINL